ncbi:Hsp70 family protein [Actinosynnema sp. NPDC050436]|uniref:Hsp70 family protein n=1 Tax=Actinosynnema sp. NPDC050436 TaxID=3155659 RepID=UPI003405DAE7
MSYVMGVDLGTTFTAAAVCRRDAGGWGPAEVLPLGTRTAAVPSVLFFGPDATVLVGEAAERRALACPGGVAREFKRRIGDRTPLLLSGGQHTAHGLAARLVRWVVDRAVEREGGTPEHLAVTHPAAWGEHKKGLLLTALAEVGLGEAALLTEPEAAAFDYSAGERVEAGTTIAVYDLGGGTFDAAVLRKVDDARFALLGDPAGADRLGGVDFDQAVFDHLRTAFAGEFDATAPDDPVAMSAVTRLRRECTEAKEALSGDTEVTIPVLLPGGHAQARLVRGEFEAMVRPALDETVALLRAAVRSAGLAEPEVDRVLLVGGSSRIPLVGRLLSQQFGRGVAVDSDPKTVVARGAARAATPTAPAVPTTPPATAEEQPPEAPRRPAVADIPLVLPDPAGRRRLLRPRVLVGAAALAVVALSAASTVTMEELHPTGSAAAPPDAATPQADTAAALEAALPDTAAQEVSVSEEQPDTPPPDRKAKPDPNVPDAGLTTTESSPTAPTSSGSPALERPRTPQPQTTPAAVTAAAAQPLGGTATPVPTSAAPPTVYAPPPTTDTPPADQPPPTEQPPPATEEAPPPALTTAEQPPPVTAEDPPPTTTGSPAPTGDPLPTT